jgi:hypothetical protein
MRQFIVLLSALIVLNVLAGCGSDDATKLRAHAAKSGETTEIKVTDKDGNVLRELKVTPKGMSGSFQETSAVPPVDEPGAKPPADEPVAEAPPADDAPTTPEIEPLFPAEADSEAAKGAQASAPDQG